MTKVPQCELIRKLCSVRAIVLVAALGMLTLAVAVLIESQLDPPLKKQQEALVEDLVSAGGDDVSYSPSLRR